MFCTCKKLKMWKKWTIVRTPKVLLSVYLDETLPLQYPLHHIVLHPLPPHHPPPSSSLLPLLLPPPLLLALSQFSQVPMNEFMDMSQYTGSYFDIWILSKNVQSRYEYMVQHIVNIKIYNIRYTVKGWKYSIQSTYESFGLTVCIHTWTVSFIEWYSPGMNTFSQAVDIENSQP